MKMQTVITFCLIGAAISFAQDAPNRAPQEGRPGPGAGPGPRFVMPLMQALDPNTDGIIDEKEIANASVALKKLDKNSDGKIDREELRPARRPDGTRPPGGEGQPRPRPPGEK